MQRKYLPEGKLPIQFLKSVLDSLPKGNMVVSPDVGIDVGVSKVNGKYLVTSSDPITGTKIRMGWHAVHVSANDVATSGIMPNLLNIVALFPRKTSTDTIQKIMNEINKTAGDLGITVAGGHTEITSLVTQPIITVTAMGTGDRFVTSASAKKFDSILMTKTAGIEGTSILASLPKVKRLLTKQESQRGSALIEQLSIMKEARVSFATGRVHAMHDVTEGGVIGAVYEMSIASSLGFELFENVVPVDKSTHAICSKISIDPLKLIGSGSLLIACPQDSERVIAQELAELGIRSTIIGRFLPARSGRYLKRINGRIRITENSIQDELWGSLRKYRNLS